MNNSQNLDQLTLFDDCIRDNIERLMQEHRCRWCRNPNHSLKAKALCSTCHRWNTEQRQLGKQVSELPSEEVKDPNWLLRANLDVANEAVKLCKAEGDALESMLRRSDAIDLEHRFNCLAKKLLGNKKGVKLFHGKTAYFECFSPTQRSWISFLVSTIICEANRRDRRRLAFSRDLQAKNAAVDARLQRRGED